MWSVQSGFACDTEKRHHWLMEKKGVEKLYRRVIDVVRGGIESGRYPVGSRLPTERELAEANDVSRTTVREAMVALEMLGVVEMRKGSGIYVINDAGIAASEPDLDIGAFELIEARRIIEGEVAALAAHHATREHIARLGELLKDMESPDEIEAESADREFHLVLAQATGNGALLSVVTDLWDMRERAPLARNILHRARGLGFELRIEEHGAVLAAVTNREAAVARKAMRAHLDRVIEHLLVTTENDDIEAARLRSATLRKRLSAA
jgi:GntR family transcriptional repressor for pyruvate dehydrogenase complex